MIIIADRAPLKIKRFIKYQRVVVVILISPISPEDEVLSEVQKSQTPICFQGGILIQLEIFVILLGLVHLAKARVLFVSIHRPLSISLLSLKISLYFFHLICSCKGLLKNL